MQEKSREKQVEGFDFPSAFSLPPSPLLHHINWLLINVTVLLHTAVGEQLTGEIADQITDFLREIRKEICEEQEEL